MSKGSILVIDDEEKLRQLIARILQLEGYLIYQAGNSHKAFQILEQSSDIQLVITDVKLPDDNGIAILEKVKAKYPYCEVIVMTAYGTIQDGVKAMKLGAFDYLTKGDEDEQIVVSAERAIEKAKMQQRIQVLENQVYTKFNFENILGESKTIQQAIHLAKKVATTNSSVLLEGETGTGKELFAQAIHQASPRKNKSFVAINCSNLKCSDTKKELSQEPSSTKKVFLKRQAKARFS
jgi:two-component system, NtrC family, response regulator